MIKKQKSKLPIIGWREWVSLPDMDIDRIKVKVDTGARSSSLHVVNLRKIYKNKAEWVRFQVHPVQRKSNITIDVEAEVLEYRSIRSSNGKVAIRPVIITNIELLGTMWPLELTLSSRDEMGFRMLLGREAFRGRFLVDANKSYYGKKSLSKKVYRNQ